MLVFKIVLAVLATYRLSLLFSKETGPWGLFEKLRNMPPEGSYLRKGLGCILCESVWWSGAICVLMCLLGDFGWIYFPVYWMAISGMAIIVNAQWPQID
jgi:hypothetical protein